MTDSNRSLPAPALAGVPSSRLYPRPGRLARNGVLSELFIDTEWLSREILSTGIKNANKDLHAKLNKRRKWWGVGGGGGGGEEVAKRQETAAGAGRDVRYIYENKSA